MKKIVKIIAGLLFIAFLLSSCNRYIVCPAYADAEKEVKVIQKDDKSS